MGQTFWQGCANNNKNKPKTTQQSASMRVTHSSNRSGQESSGFSSVKRELKSRDGSEQQLKAALSVCSVCLCSYTAAEHENYSKTSSVRLHEPCRGLTHTHKASLFQYSNITIKNLVVFLCGSWKDAQRLVIQIIKIKVSMHSPYLKNHITVLAFYQL